MLVLTRKVNESVDLTIKAGTYTEDIVINVMVTQAANSRGEPNVRLGFDAAKDLVHVLRHELTLKQAETPVAVTETTDMRSDPEPFAPNDLSPLTELSDFCMIG